MNIEHCGASMSKQYVVTLNCYIAKGDWIITAHRLWHVVKQGLSLHSVGFTIKNFFCLYNIPKVTASSTRQVLISDRTITFSKSSSLCGKRACNNLGKFPPTQKIGITSCFLWSTVQRWVFSANFCVLSEKEGDEKGDNPPLLYTLLSKTLLSSQTSTLYWVALDDIY